MKAGVKILVSFIVGAAAGAGITYYVTKEKYEKIAKEDVESVKAELEKKYKKEREEAEAISKMPNANKPDVNEVYKESLNKYKSSNNEKPKKDKNSKTVTRNVFDYNKVPSVDIDEDPADGEHPIDSDEESSSMSTFPEPYAIPLVMFEEDMQYAKVSLNYYEEDHTLANEADEILMIQDTIGEESLEHIGDEEPDMLYVRNEKHGCDYEISVVHNSYAYITQGHSMYEEG